MAAGNLAFGYKALPVSECVARVRCVAVRIRCCSLYRPGVNAYSTLGWRLRGSYSVHCSGFGHRRRGFRGGLPWQRGQDRARPAYRVSVGSVAPADHRGCAAREFSGPLPEVDGSRGL